MRNLLCLHSLYPYVTHRRRISKFISPALHKAMLNYHVLYIWFISCCLYINVISFKCYDMYQLCVLIPFFPLHKWCASIKCCVPGVYTFLKLQRNLKIFTYNLDILQNRNGVTWRVPPCEVMIQIKNVHVCGSCSEIFVLHVAFILWLQN